MVRRGYPCPGHARPAGMAATVILFPNPCPVCGTTDEHAAWAQGGATLGSPATFCPHPREPGHGTGCCCAGRSRPWTAGLPAELLTAPAGAPSLEERVTALEECIRFPLRMHLSPDEIRQLLRECVTVVKPGETLVVRVPLTWTPDDVNRYSRTIGELNEALDLPFRTLVVP